MQKLNEKGYFYIKPCVAASVLHLCIGDKCLVVNTVLSVVLRLKHY